EFMSRIRGGCNSSTLRVSSKRNNAIVDKIDILIPLDQKAIEHLNKRITKETIIFSEKANFNDNFKDKCKMVEVAFSDIAKEIGNKLYSNTVAAGLISGLFSVDINIFNEFVKQGFADKLDDIINANLEAGKKGYEIGTGLLKSESIKIEVNKDCIVQNEIIINGTEAIGMGCIAGGCDFVSSYPMSPSTGVLIFLAAQSEKFDILVEQAEDEIAAINMALGAWYAGARGMATTSGGGFALMGEGVSLSGMTETPVVIHIAQRPGPATGLPTRTEQGDLNLVLYSGHGEFPRIIYAPGDLQDGFDLAYRAFNQADKFQIPVFILSDQYFVDSYYNTPAFDVSKLEVEHYIVKTEKDYKRYELTENGLSPRGIPGYGEGLVAVDSDEHDEYGRITESMDVRSAMSDKRLKKLDLILDDLLAPVLVGPKNYKNLIIAWGSTLNVIKESLDKLGRNDTALLHFKQVYPLHPETINYLKKAEHTIIIENNATSQFGNLIKQDTGLEIDTKILKYTGLAFTVEEVVDNLINLI
ncbi:MAG: 2-oxoacid:acceptor oxidoreductase subunit alpha, partial [Cyanobacteriota bacterium]